MRRDERAPVGMSKLHFLCTKLYFNINMNMGRLVLVIKGHFVSVLPSECWILVGENNEITLS